MSIFKWTARGLSLFSMVFTAGYWITRWYDDREGVRYANDQKHMDKRDMKRWNP